MLGSIPLISIIVSLPDTVACIMSPLSEFVQAFAVSGDSTKL